MLDDLAVLLNHSALSVIASGNSVLLQRKQKALR